MPVYHRTQRLQIFGEKPEIQKLYGSRYRMVVRCVAKNDTKAWYDDNKAQIFADFGSLYSAQMSVDGIDARTGEAYDDMVLVKNEATYTQSGEYVIVFTYETLTDSFVQETEDKVDFDLNGLKRLTRTIIAKDTVAYSSVVGTSTTGTSPVLTLAQVSEDQLEASEDGFKRIQEVWLEGGTLSETLDNVGSQKAKVIETIGTDPATPTGYSLASKQESDFEGFQTNRFTFLKPSILSLQQDFNNGLKRVSVQAFGMTATSVSAELAAITSSHALISQNESDYEGIKTSTFQYQIDEAFTEDYELNGLKRVSLIELSASDFSAQTVGGVSTTAPTTGLYLGTQNIDNGGIIKVRESVWLESGTLSETLDNVGSQKAKVIETIGADPATPSGYSLASKQESDFEGLQTNRFTFLKDNVILSESEDKVGSQVAIVQEVFNGTPATPSGYVVANEQISDVDGIPTRRYTFLKPSILSLRQELSGGSKQVSVQAFGLDVADVISALSVVTSGHVLLSQSESDYAGIKTTTFEFRLDKSFTEDYELNGLKRISLVELSVGAFTAQTIGSASSSAPTTGLYLGTQKIDNGGSIKTRESVWIESGKLSESKASQSEGVVRVTTSFLAHDGFDLSANTVGPIIAKTTDDFEGYETITVITLQDANGDSVVSDNVVSHTLLSPFTYPGTVEIDYDLLGGPGANFAAYDFKLTPPCQSLVESTMKISFKTTSDISYSSTRGLWNPTSWAEGTSAGIGWNYSPFSITQAFRGYRATGTTSVFGQGGNNPFTMISGKRIYLNAGYAIRCSGGPGDPVFGEYTLNYDVSLAFEDVDGNKYYKHREIVSTIPSQT